MDKRAEFTHQDPVPRLYNDPFLSPLEFLLCVMHDEHLPMATRIQAASAALPFTTPYPRPTSHEPRCTYVIPPLSYEPWSEVCSPWPRSTENHSQNPDPATITVTHDADPGDPQNLTRDPEPLPSPDYSRPPTPEEIREIKAVINKLRPDLAHLPVPEPHLCAGGHWMFGPCPLGERCRDSSLRDPSKLN